MVKKRIISISITLIILLSIGFLLFVNYYNFKLSPLHSEGNKIMESVKIFINENDLEEFNLYNRYHFDKVYYSGFDNDYLYVFDDEGILLNKTNKDNIDLDQALKLGHSLFEEYELSFLVIDKKIVYVIVSSYEDVFYNLEFEEISRLRKGISNE